MSNLKNKDLERRWEEDENPFSVNNKVKDIETNIEVVIKDGKVSLIKNGKEIKKV